MSHLPLCVYLFCLITFFFGGTLYICYCSFEAKGVLPKMHLIFCSILHSLGLSHPAFKPIVFAVYFSCHKYKTEHRMELNLWSTYQVSGAVLCDFSALHPLILIITLKCGYSWLPPCHQLFSFSYLLWVVFLVVCFILYGRRNSEI